MNYLAQFNNPLFRVFCIARGHDHVPGGIAELLPQLTYSGDDHRALVNNNPGLIQEGSIFTCTSSPEGLRDSGCHEDAFAVFQNTDHGLEITAYITQRY